MGKKFKKNDNFYNDYDRDENYSQGLNYKKIIFILLLIIVVILIFSNYRNKNNNVSKNSNSLENTLNNEIVEEKEEDKTATIVAIGDTLCHSQVFNDAYDSETGIYDFSPLFKYVTKYFENKTVAVRKSRSDISRTIS